MSIITYFIMRLLGFENYGPWFRTFATGRGNSKFFVQPTPVLITSECGRQGSSGREGAGGKDIGQIGTYVNIVDDLVKTDFDAKTIGLIICKSKNNILAKYAVNSSKEPIGISEYKLSNLLPVEYRASMPTIEEIENELR